MGKEQDQTVTTTSVPWTNTGRLRTLSDKAERQFRSDINPWKPQVYQGDWIAPMSDYTRQAQNAMTNVYRPDQITRIYDRMRGNTNLYQNEAQKLARLGGGMSGSEDMYGRMMSGDEMYRDFDRIKESTIDDAQAALGSTFGGGMMNGGLIAQEYGRGLGDAIGGLEYDAYNQAQNRALQAGGQMDAAYNAMTGRQIAGMNMLPQYNDMLQSGYDWRSGNLDNQANAYLRAGSIDESYAQRLADAERARFGETDAQTRTGMQNYANFLLGIGGAGSSGSQTQPGPSPIGTALGGAATGLGTYGALAMNPVTAPYAAVGGVLSGLGSIF